VVFLPQGILELQAIDGETRYHKPQRANQLIGGLTWSGHNKQLAIEAYYKDYHRQTDRYENLFNTFVILPEIEPDRFKVLADTAHSKGIDIEYSSQLGDSLQWQLRYSYLRAQEKVEGKQIPRRWQQRHAVNAIARWKRNSFEMSVALSWHDGWRASQLPAQLSSADGLEIIDVLNNTSLRNFLSLDIAASKRWSWRKNELLIYADISNVLNRSNSAGLEYAPQIEDDFVEFELENEALLPLIPTVGFSFTF